METTTVILPLSKRPAKWTRHPHIDLWPVILDQVSPIAKDLTKGQGGHFTLLDLTTILFTSQPSLSCILSSVDLGAMLSQLGYAQVRKYVPSIGRVAVNWVNRLDLLEEMQ